MISEETRILISHRLAQAEEALSDADFLLERGSHRATVNRAYYGMFYAILALLHLLGKGTSKHSGAIALFDREFVRSGAFNKEFSRWLHEVFLDRQRSDYDELVLVSRQEAAEALDHARRFVEQAKDYLAEHMGGLDNQ